VVLDPVVSRNALAGGLYRNASAPVRLTPSEAIEGFWRGQYGAGHDPGLTYDRGRVEVAVRTTHADDAIDEEARLIRRLRPRDNLLGQPAEEIPF
jgi:hypothetical protein